MMFSPRLSANAARMVPSSASSGLVAPISFRDRKSTRLNSSHVATSYAVFCLKKNIAMMIPEELKIKSIGGSVESSRSSGSEAVSTKEIDGLARDFTEQHDAKVTTIATMDERV